MAKTKPGKKDLDSCAIKGIHKVVKHHRNNVKVRVRWYYRPEESLGGRRQFHEAKELFLSDHYDMQSAHTIEGKHSFKNYTKLENVGTEDYFCRFEYKAATGGFTPDRVAVYYKFEMPYNPDDLMVQCEGCKDGFHPSCMGMSIEEAKKLENFLCSDCSSDEDAKRTVNSFSVSPSLETKEEVRSHVLELESNLVSENEKFASIIGRVDKYRETKREMDRRFDMQYQRSIAEALDNHLTAVQRDHEHKSQIEERRIRDDAVREEAQRREKAVQEEKVRQQKLRAEAEIQARLEAERAAKAEAEKAVALEAERKAAEEAAKKKTSSAPPQGSASQVTESKQSAGNMTRGAENALKLEVERLRAYTELAAQNNAMRLRSNMKIARNIRQITGTKEIVRAKANELIKLISDPSCPHSISIASFADKFVSLCENSTGSFNRFVYSYGHVIVLVTSKVPIAMDILIAQLNRVCIYTAPKHIIY